MSVPGFNALPHRQNIPSMSMAMAGAPAGTFLPGTKVTVGSHKVIVDRYLSEGGFAHVYLVKLPSKVDGSTIAVLKRVAVPDKARLAGMRIEVETMKLLKGNRHIVSYIDSHASELANGGGYEVFLLMEYCAGGGLIDFMNTRLQNRLTESEVLNIFQDVAEGVACMHYLEPPLLHRDLKVENVLISSTGRYKVCDFGSAKITTPAPRTPEDCRRIEDDIQRHTTMQYRSPEMVDVYRKLPIDEKSDIWALGVLLYKLCYYTTPFEEQGQLAILNASYKYPAYPAFSDRIKKLIATMLRENPKERPNIYQVVRDTCTLRGTTNPLKDIYTHPRKPNEVTRKPLPSKPPGSASGAGASYVQPPVKEQVIPDIAPMRRGRPTTQQVRQQPVAAKSSSTDPFATLDGQKTKLKLAPKDELSSKFPTLDEFTLMQDAGAKFDFGKPKQEKQGKDLNARVLERLADDAFAQPLVHAKSAPSNLDKLGGGQVISPPLPSQTANLYQSPPPILHTPPQQSLTSHATIASSEPTSVSESRPSRSILSKAMARTPSLGRSRDKAANAGHDSSKTASSPSVLKSDGGLLKRPSFLGSRSSSQTNLPDKASSSRPSLEGSRPSFDAAIALSRSRSAHSNSRPTSSHIESDLDFLKAREGKDVAGGESPRQGYLPSRQSLMYPPEDDTSSSEEEIAIASNVDFLRKMEEEDGSRKRDRRSGSSGSKHSSRRTSIPTISLSGTKSLLAGRFGDAFRRFETNTGSAKNNNPENDRLSTILGSERTGGTSDNDGLRDGDESDDLSPEMRREVERRRLSAEEKRVAAAGEEYRQRLDRKDHSRPAGNASPVRRTNAGGALSDSPSRASSIQHRVKTLLDSNKSPVPSPTFPPATLAQKPFPIDVEASRIAASSGMNNDFVPAGGGFSAVENARPFSPGTQAAAMFGQTRQLAARSAGGAIAPPTSISSAPVSATVTAAATSGPRPSAPPKPKALRPQSGMFSEGLSPSKLGPVNTFPSSILSNPMIAASAPVSAVPSTAGAGVSTTSLPNAGGGGEDWERTFQSRYPSLTDWEMVETEIGFGTGRDKRQPPPKTTAVKPQTRSKEV